MEKSFQLTSDSRQLPPFREALRTLLNSAGFGEKETGNIVLAVDEGLTNIIRHAYGGKEGRIEVTFGDYPDRTEITLRDYGVRFDPTKLPAPELPPTRPGGLGVHLMRTLMDRTDYDVTCTDGNRLTLVKLKSGGQEKSS